MGRRGTLGLTLLALVLGVYLWFEPSPSNRIADSGDMLQATPQPAISVQPLLKFTPAEVTGVRLERAGRTVEAERRSDGWQQTEPPGVIDDFLRNLTQLGVLAEIPATGTELQDYGLQPPQSTLELRFGGADAPLILQLGDRNPATTGVYVRVGNGPVLLAGALAEWEFDKAFKALANTHG